MKRTILNSVQNFPPNAATDHLRAAQLDRDGSQDLEGPIYPGMPTYVADETEFVAAVGAGIADIEAGRTVPFETVAAELRRIIRDHT